MPTYEVVLVYDQVGFEALNVLHYQPANANPINWQSICDEIAARWTANIATVIAPSVTFEGIRVREDIAGAVGVTYNVTGGAVAGTAADNQFAANLAMLVQKKSIGSIRPVLGRAYQPGVSSEGLTSNGLWSATVQTAVEAFWDVMIAIAAVGSPVLQLVIKASNPTAPNTQAYTEVDTTEANLNPKTQRRRTRGVGV